jgi:hypothetical protein
MMVPTDLDMALGRLVLASTTGAATFDAATSMAMASKAMRFRKHSGWLLRDHHVVLHLELPFPYQE